MTNFNSSNSNNPYVIKASVRDTEIIADLLSEGLVDIEDLYDPYKEERRQNRREAAAEDQRTAQERSDAIKEWIEF